MPGRRQRRFARFVCIMVREQGQQPCNDYGFEQAGMANTTRFRAHSKSSKLKRSYSRQLTEMLEEDQVYCVSFDLSLAEMSRYAVPDIGALLSDRKCRSGSNPLTTDPDVTQSNKPCGSQKVGKPSVARLWARARILGHRLLRRRCQH